MDTFTVTNDVITLDEAIDNDFQTDPNPDGQPKA
jgi:hypothetical protein